MATFSSAQIGELQVYFGYSSLPSDIQVHLEGEFNQATVDRTAEILIDLADINSKIKAARSDSMAMVVSDIQLNWALHLKCLRQDYSDLLLELSEILGVKIASSKHQRKKTSFTSYW